MLPTSLSTLSIPLGLLGPSGGPPVRGPEIGPFATPLLPFRGVVNPDFSPGSGSDAAPLPGAAPRSFQSQLQSMIDETRNRDVVAQREIEAFSRGDNPGRIHEVMVAVSKADISLRTLTTVRNKLVDAYHQLLQTTA